MTPPKVVADGVGLGTCRGGRCDGFCEQPGSRWMSTRTRVWASWVLAENLSLAGDTVGTMTGDKGEPTAELKKVPLFFVDVSAIADEDVDEWAQRMAEYVSRVTGLPLVEDGPESGDTGDSSG